MIDQSARLEALNPHISFIMEAPAGSGKTEVLVRRMLSLLLEVVHPRNILAITFTRKAALEMHERLFTSLKEMPQDKDKAKLVTEVRQRIEAEGWQQDDLERISIMTIDALCARILNQEGRSIDIHAEVIPDYSVLGDALMFELLAHLESRDDYATDLETLLLYFGNNIEKVKKLLLDILAERVEWLSVFVSRQNKVHSLKDELRANVRDLYQVIWDKWQQLTPMSWVSEINRWCGISGAGDIKRVAEVLLSKQGELRKRFDARLGLPPELKLAYLELMEALAIDPQRDRWCALLKEIQALPPLDLEPPPVLEALLKILPLTAAHWQILLKEQHYRDFQEEALQAVINLSSNDPVSMALMRFERELKHILVDEFQDTSRLQFRLLELMTQTWVAGDGRTLFLVGDPMQSIYRFRDARVELFLEAKDKGIAALKLKPLRLIANFRTDPSVLKFINETLIEVFPKYSDVLTGAVPFTPSQAERHYADAGGVQFERFSSIEDESSAVLEKIKIILAEDPEANIGILGRSRAQLKPLMQTLLKENLPIQAEAWGQLTEAQLILDVVSLTSALTHLGDRLSWMALLRSPLIDLDLDTLLMIAQLSHDKTIWEVLGEQDQPELRHLVGLLTPHIFAAEACLVTRVRNAFTQLAADFQFSALEHHLLTQYWQFLAQYPLISSRAQFLEALARQKLNYDADKARIKLLTIHQAKGLEFDYVFLPNLNVGVRRDDPPLLRWQEFHYQHQFKLLVGLHKSASGAEDPIYGYLKCADQEENKYEQVRLLYVALTRAKKSLNISYVMEEVEQPKAGSFLRFFKL